jgi:hypothetical protein
MTNPVGKQWTDIGSDVNWSEYGGKWARHISGTRYHVIRFENCAEWGDGATGYHCDLQEVDTTNPQLLGALDSAGLPHDGLDEYGDPFEPWELMKVGALSGHGAYAPLWQEAGTNSHKLLRAAKRESRLLASDTVAYEQRMDRPVNKVGSTAREYATGDVSSAILRGIAEGDPRAELMAKMGMLQVIKVG